MSLALALQRPTLEQPARVDFLDPRWFTPEHHARVLTHVPFIARKVLQRLLTMPCGELIISLPNGTRVGVRGDQPGTAARLRLHNWRGLRHLFWDGDLGLAQAYIDGDWQTDNLSAVLTWGAENATALFTAISGQRLGHTVRWVQHFLRRNSKAGSRRNIMAHYDLGNEFYAAWLDESMTYSAGIFGAEAVDLKAAQERKYARLLTDLALTGPSHILEIGCGWGGMIEHVLRYTPHRITAVTISPAQLAYAQARIQTLPDAQRARLELRDYRDLSGQYDGIVSIEMIEAVGEKYWPVYAAQLKQLLKPKACAALQLITIADDRFEAYRRTPDFIQHYVFPGGMLLSPRLLDETLQKAGLRVTQSRGHAADYAITLHHWQQRFAAAWPRIETMGFDTRFRRLWDYYLAYCEAGFNTQLTDLLQVQIRHS